MDRFDDHRLVKAAGDAWTAGTQAEFLDGVRGGTLPQEAFERWLEQDHRFVLGLTRFALVLASKAPRDVQKVLVGGIAALDDELDWFIRHLTDRGLDSAVEEQPVCRRYVDFLLSTVHARPMEVSLAAFFGVEAAYCVGWGRLRPADGSTPGGVYGEFIDRWTHPAFTDYVADLGRLADRFEHPDQQAVFDEVMRHEAAFWRMTTGGEA